MRSVALALLAIIAVVIGVSVAGAAFGQQAAPCAPIDTVRKVLAEHDEASVWTGLDERRGMILQLWQSPGGGWTLIAISPGGVGCLIAAGVAAEVRNAL